MQGFQTHCKYLQSIKIAKAEGQASMEWKNGNGVVQEKNLISKLASVSIPIDSGVPSYRQQIWNFALTFVLNHPNIVKHCAFSASMELVY
jgi:hypothetical protein